LSQVPCCRVQRSRCCNTKERCWVCQYSKFLTATVAQDAARNASAASEARSASASTAAGDEWSQRAGNNRPRDRDREVEEGRAAGPRGGRVRGGAALVQLCCSKVRTSWWEYGPGFLGQHEHDLKIRA
jgi:hypothetical protein